MFETTAIYAAILTVIGLILSVQVSIHRARAGVSLGDGQDPELLVKIRRFGNFNENVPLMLILMGFAEAGGLAPIWLHASGAIMVLARLIHPFGLAVDRPATFARIAGSSGSKVATLIPLIAILIQKFAG